MKKFKRSIVFKSVFGIVLMLSVFSAIVCAMGFKEFTNALLSQYTESAFQVADTAALLVDPDRMDAYAESGGETEEYRGVWDRMDQLCNSSESTFIYVIRPDLTDYGHITFLFSTINRNSTYSHYDFGYVRETTNDEYREKYKKLYDGVSDREMLVRDKGYIETDPHITVMIPLKGADGKTTAILCVQKQMDVLTAARNAYVRKVFLVLLVIALLAAIGQAIYLNRVFLTPVKEITSEASRFAKENVSPGVRLTDKIKNEDEIGVLAQAIDQMEEQIHTYVGDLTRITAEKERASTELALATRIQSGMLPSSFPAFPDRKEFDIFAFMEPAKEVGGDFYDFFLIDDDHLCIDIADVSGKGVPAALFMMASKIILANQILAQKSPAKALERTNEMICSNNREEMFVTTWIGVLEISTGKLTAANAGHEFPIVTDVEGKYELVKDKHGFVVGAMEGMKYREYELDMKPGSKILVYTDGVPEAINEKGEMFGTDRLLTALNHEPEADPERQLELLMKDLNNFVGEVSQFDDITMLCLQYLGPEKGNEEHQTENVTESKAESKA